MVDSVGVRRTPKAPAPRVLSAAGVLLASYLASFSAASQEPISCADILHLIEQSKSQFSEIQGSTESDFGGYDATFVLPDVWYCAILEDVEKASYKCTWKYPLGDEQAHEAFERLAKTMRNCIGHMADEQTDRPVNHPDFYASRYYRLPGGEARVTLKNKAKMVSTLVSIVIDGFTKPR
jgi:hypothetical protein